MKWPVVKVGDIAKQIRGVSYAKEQAKSSPGAGLKPVLRANNITDAGLTFTDLIYVPDSCIFERQLILAGDIVVAASSGSLAVVGKAGQAQSDFAGSFGAFCKLVRPNNLVHAGFLGHFFKTDAYRRRISSLAEGANINNLRNEHIDDLEIPLPPMEEQQRIAAILDQAEALRAKRRQALAKLDTLIQSIFLNVFGDPFLSDDRWPLRTLGSVCEFENGDRSSNYPSGEELVQAGVLFLNGKNMVEDQLNLTSRTYITAAKFASLSRGKARENDLVITLRGTLGSCIIFRDAGGPAFINAQMMIIRPTKDLLPEYVHAVLTSKAYKAKFQEIRTGAAVPQLTSSQLKQLPLFVPPHAVQADYLAKSEQVTVATKQAAVQLKKMEILLVSLQNRAFRGEL